MQSKEAGGMKLKTVRMITHIAAWAGMIVALFAYFYLDSYGLWWVGILVMIWGALFHFSHYRCPNCRRHLRDRGEYCPFCGEKLESS
jgi:hypothetical protein